MCDIVAVRRTCAIAVLLLGIACLMSLSAQASPTGLNHIPTADVVDKDVLVLQAWGSFDGESSWFAGFKYGPADNWEVGLDDLFSGAGSNTGPALQAKHRIPLQGGAAAALGLANVSTDTDVNGEYYPYAVVTAPLGTDVHGTLGYSFQSGNQALFFGGSWCVNPRFSLRADWTQTDNGDEAISSLGCITQLNDRWLAEAWASFPTAADLDTSYTVKVDCLIPVTW